METKHLVYIGQRPAAKGGGVVHVYRAIDPDWNDGRTLDEMRTLLAESYAYSKPLFKSHTPGAILKANIESDGTVLIKSVQWFGLWQNQTERAVWKAQDEAYRAGKRDSRRNDLKEVLAPFRDAYAAMPYSRKAEYLASIIRYITHGG